MGLIIAIMLLTTLPLPFKFNLTDSLMVKSIKYYPFVGLLIGGILYFVSSITNYLNISDSINGLLIIATYLLLTGGLHLDGLADTFDGIFSRKSKEQILEIMRDSQIGTFGVLSLIFIILMKYILYTNLISINLSKIILITPVISRLVMVFVITFFKYAREDNGMGKSYIELTTKKDFILPLLFSFIIIFYITNYEGLMISILSFLLILPFIKMIDIRINGVTGDVLGAVNEITDPLTMLLFIIGDGLGW